MLVYAGMGTSLLLPSPAETFLRLRVEYKKSAVYGDILYPSYKIQDGISTVALGDENGKPYAVVELKHKGEQNDEIGRKASIDD